MYPDSDIERSCKYVYCSEAMMEACTGKEIVMLSPGHTALYGLITAKARQNVISSEADKIKQIKQNN
jgi:hypothetical protein